MNTGPGQGTHGPSSLPNWWPADPRHSTSTTSDVMSQLCRVCGEPAAGFHFGAFTCEGCKSFFGRTYNNLSSISECKNNGECVINKKNRTSCKACRLRKCLVVGMSKSGSRYGRRSNWFKIHCLLQEQQQQHHQHQHQQHHLHQQQSTGLHFQQNSSVAAGRPSLEQGRASPPPLPPPPPSWADVKHHLRLDADNNNSVAGDLNKHEYGAGRLSSVSAAAAAAAVVQAVRPELLRWPSPFFPAFPFPPPTPFFLAAMHGQPPPAPGRGMNRSPSNSPVASRSSSSSSSTTDRRPSTSPERVAVRRDLLPVQESPMDLSVSSAADQPPTAPSRSPSPLQHESGGSRPTRPGSSPATHRSGRKRQRHRSRSQCADRTSCSGESAVAGSESDSNGSAAVGDGGARTAKNVPLDLTCNDRP